MFPEASKVPHFSYEPPTVHIIHFEFYQPINDISDPIIFFLIIYLLYSSNSVRVVKNIFSYKRV